MTEITLESLNERLNKIEINIKMLMDKAAPKGFMTCSFKEHDEKIHGPRGQWYRLASDLKMDHTCKCGYSGVYSDVTKYAKLPKGTLKSF